MKRFFCNFAENISSYVLSATVRQRDYGEKDNTRLVIRNTREVTDVWYVPSIKINNEVLL